MGNAIAGAGKGKVVLSNGTVLEYDKPLTVAELMMEHPQQVVVEFPAKSSGHRPAPLPADKKLEMNRVYVMVPLRRGNAAVAPLSSEEARRILVRANSFLKSNSFYSMEGVVPLFFRRVFAKNCKEVSKSKVMEVNDDQRSEIVVVEERPEFLIRQVSGKGWKPSLDTITEKSMHPKVRHWLV